MCPRDHSPNVARPRLLWLGLLALLFGGGPDARASDWVEGEVIVSFDKSASAADKAGALGLLDAEIVREFRFIDAALCRLRSATVESVIDGKLALPVLIDVEPNLVLQPCWMPDDPLFGSQWYLHHTAAQAGTPGADIRAVHAWDVERGSREVIVAVIDEYIDYTHPDLWPNVFVNADEIADNGIDDDANGYIDDVHGLRLWSGYPSLSNEHGLVCAGVVTAAADNAEGIAGVADVTLLPVAVGDGGINFLDASGAIAGIEYAMLMGADVISLSYGSFHAGWLDTGLQAACRAAGEAGIFMTFSAGNDGLDPLPAPFYPACFDVDRIISVGGSDLLDHNAFNAHPEWVDVAAPGVAIRTCGLDGSYVSVGGTSLAAPMVAGVLALGISKYGDQPGFDAKARLLATADRIPALEGKNVVGGRSK
ncbi:hypothetical protein FJ250_13700, partial [bacterium]|nr:hypothetical protein [bacterium]